MEEGMNESKFSGIDSIYSQYRSTDILEQFTAKQIIRSGNIS